MVNIQYHAVRMQTCVQYGKSRDNTKKRYREMTANDGTTKQ